MKKSGISVINTVRAHLVQRQTLQEALRARRIAGAAFDVFWSELANPADPLLAESNFVLTPHVAGFSNATIASIGRTVAESIHRLRDGRSLNHVV